MLQRGNYSNLEGQFQLNCQYCDQGKQVIKVNNFRQLKFLIPVANGSTAYDSFIINFPVL